MSQESLLKLINRFWRHINRYRKKQIAFLFFLIIVTSILEVVTIGAILPFLGVLTEPDKVYSHHLIQPLVNALGISSPDQLILPVTIIFIASAIASGVFRLILLYTTTRLSFAIGADISLGIYKRTLYQKYSTHVARNSSEIIDGIFSKTRTTTSGVLMPMLNLISSVVLMSSAILALLIIDPVATSFTFGGFGVIYLGIIRLTRQKLDNNSQRIADNSTQVIKSLQEGLGGIRDVLLDGSQELYCKVFRNADLPLRWAQGSNLVISASPRFLMESLGMVLIASVAYFMSQRDIGILSAIPVLGAIAIAAQRLLPVLQQTYSSLTSIRGARASLGEVVDLLDQELPDYAEKPLPAPIPFQYKIDFHDLGFRYSESTSWIFQSVNLRLLKGSSIGIMGKTGSGKSTLLDLIMGLLTPSQGVISIDGKPLTQDNLRAWQAHIAHVPQDIYLSDGSIEENIAFGHSKDNINHSLVRRAAEQAQLSETIESLPEKYKTSVGEKGVRLSGGQRQRIGIARALYKEADVIVFDEATSALDNATENAIIEEIRGLGNELTVIIVAHRLTTMKYCDVIIELGDKDIERIGTFEELIGC